MRPPPRAYVRSRKNIAGCILAVGGPVLIFAGVVAAPVGLALMPVLYAIGALAAPPRRRVDVVAGLDKNDVRTSLDKIQRRSWPGSRGGSAPRSTRSRERSKTSCPASTGSAPARRGSMCSMCATDYLPTAIQAYLDLPRHYADTHVVADGKTSLDLLADQLDLLEKEINEIVDNVNRADADRLVANGRFLEEKFGSHPLDPDREQGV